MSFTQKPKGILLVNLGTPDSSATRDVRKYLREFLSDPRVIDINPIGRYILVNAIIAPFRSPKSAATYRKVWTKEGSPLMVNGAALEIKLQESLGDQFRVGIAMRYQSPSIESVLNKMQSEGIDDIKVIPLFPQYASATGGSVNEKVMEVVSKWQTIPKLTFIKSFHDHPKMIYAFAENGRLHGIENFDHVLFSFHGLPKRQLRKADLSGRHCKGGGECCKTLTEINKNCYGAQCQDTARAIAQELGLPESRYSVAFQSRLGSDPWIGPYTSEVLQELIHQGKKRVLVFCPAFVSDCLETIYEIAMEYEEEFLKEGGETLQLVESLNTSPNWVEALKEIALSDV